MSAAALLHTMFRYQAWANDELLAKLAGLDPARYGEQHHAALRLVNHIHVVSLIFAAHLVGEPHGFANDNTPETPAADELRAAVAEQDRWYLDYLDAVTPAQLNEAVAFTFTDGDRGCMSRQEMLTHVVLHGGYHRGEAGRILGQMPVSPPWDTFAVYLHRAEPARRLGTVLSAA